MTISVTVAPTAAMPEIPGGGLWRAGRFWPLGATTITVVDNEWYEPEYFAAAYWESRSGLHDTWTPRKLQPQSPDLIAAMNAETGGISPYDIAPSTAAPGAYEDTATRTTIGQRALAELLNAPQSTLTVEVLG